MDDCGGAGSGEPGARACGMSGRAEIAVGRLRIYVRRHWDIALWRRRFFWFDAKRFQSGFVVLVAGIEVAVYKVRPE